MFHLYRTAMFKSDIQYSPTTMFQIRQYDVVYMTVQHEAHRLPLADLLWRILPHNTSLHVSHTYICTTEQYISIYVPQYRYMYYSTVRDGNGRCTMYVHIELRSICDQSIGWQSLRMHCIVAQTNVIIPCYFLFPRLWGAPSEGC